MADTTPISNQLNIDLANMLDDPVTAGVDNGATASTDGLVFTSAKRNQYLIEAYSWYVTEQVKKGGVDNPLLRGAISSQTIAAFSSAGVTVNLDYLYPSRLIATTNVYKYFSALADLVADSQATVSYAYAIIGGKLYAYARASGTLTVQNTGAATLYYLQAPRKDTTTGSNIAVNTAPDVGLDPSAYQPLKLYAAYRAAMDKASADMIAKATSFQVQLKNMGYAI